MLEKKLMLILNVPFKQEYNTNLMHLYLFKGIYTIIILDPVTKNLEISS